MTTSKHDISHGEQTGARTESDPHETEFSRRAVLHLAGGVATLAAVSGVMAQSAAPGGQQSGTATRVRLVVNGEAHQLELDPRQSLLDVLRERLNLTGTKKGCNQGACGACTILLNGKRVVSCLTLAAMHDGSRIETIEGLANGADLHPLQAAFIEHEGLQCGYCTPGQIMSGLGCIAEGHAGSPEEIQFWMSGNICRCGAYPGIVASVADAARRT